MFGTLLEGAFFSLQLSLSTLLSLGLASRWLTFRRSVIIYLFICLLFNHLYQDPLQCTCKIAGLSLEGLFEAKLISGVSYIKSSRSVRKSTNSSVMATSRKLIITVRLLKLTLEGNLLLLSNDVSTNPRPVEMGNLLYSPKDSSFSSTDSDELACLLTGPINESTSSSDSVDEIQHSYFDLRLDEKGIRIGHWNVNHLTLDKFDQIKVFLLGKLGKPQLDVLLLNETFLKPNVQDTLFEVPGHSIYRRDTVNKSGGGVMAYINDNLNVIRRTDLENHEVEVIWLEVCPFKSKRSLLIASIYRPPSYTKADYLSLEANLERVYLLNNETIFLGDVNIDGRNIACKQALLLGRPRENARARGRGKESLQRSLINFHFHPGNSGTLQSVKTVIANVPQIRKVTTACQV